MWIFSNFIRVEEWRSYGDLWDSVDRCGVSCLNGNGGLGPSWYVATYTRDAFWMQDINSVSERPWQSNGGINNVFAGISCFYGASWLAFSYWGDATKIYGELI